MSDQVDDRTLTPTRPDEANPPTPTMEVEQESVTPQEPRTTPEMEEKAEIASMIDARFATITSHLEDKLTSSLDKIEERLGRRQDLMIREFDSRSQSLESKLLSKLSEKASVPGSPAVTRISTTSTPDRGSAASHRSSSSISSNLVVPETPLWHWAPDGHRYEKSDATRLAKFQGGLNDDIDRWIAKIEGQARNWGVGGTYLVSNMSQALEDQAYNWFCEWTDSLPDEASATWESLRASLKLKRKMMVPPQKIFSKAQQMQQGERSWLKFVSDYTREIARAERTWETWGHPERIDNLISGARPEIRDHLMNVSVSTVEDLTKVVLGIERQLEEKMTRQQSSKRERPPATPLNALTSQKPSSPPSKFPKFTPTGESQREPCTFCGNKSHREDVCYSKKDKDGICGVCGKAKHGDRGWRFCPEKTNRSRYSKKSG